MKFLKEYTINENKLNSSIKIKGKSINIKNFNLDQNFYKDNNYVIFFKKEPNGISYYYKKIFKIYFPKKYNTCFNLKTCLRKSKYIEIINNEKNCDILFANPLKINDSFKKKRKIMNILYPIINICHKTKLYHLTKGNDYSINSKLIKNGIIPNDVMNWNQNQLLICKPQNGSCGKGIFIKPFKEMIEYIQKEKIHNFLLQEYIESKLVRGKKFDLRIYVFLTSKGDFFISEHGFLRLAQKKYDSKKTDISIHLTNTSIAKQNSEIIAFNTWKEKNKYLDNIKYVISDILNKYNTIYGNKDNKNFHLLGFDLMIDKNDTIRIIEINKRPSMKFISNLSRSIKEKMVNDLVKFFQKYLD